VHGGGQMMRSLKIMALLNMVCVAAQSREGGVVRLEEDDSSDTLGSLNHALALLGQNQEKILKLLVGEQQRAASLEQRETQLQKALVQALVRMEVIRPALRGGGGEQKAEEIVALPTTESVNHEQMLSGGAQVEQKAEEIVALCQLLKAASIMNKCSLVERRWR
jgi:hypothetical protein